MATQTFLRTVARVVGADVIDDAVAFFQAFDGMEEGFKRRATRVQERLCDEDTAFALVASPRRATIAEATYFAEKLPEGGIAVRCLILNTHTPRAAHCLPEATQTPADALSAPQPDPPYHNTAHLHPPS